MFRNDTCFGEREQCHERTALKRASSRANGTKVRAPPEGRRRRSHRDWEADESGRAHRYLGEG